MKRGEWQAKGGGCWGNILRFATLIEEQLSGIYNEKGVGTYLTFLCAKKELYLDSK